MSADGAVTAVAVGSTYVRVITEDGGYRDSCEITVLSNDTNLTAVSVQETFKLAVYPNPADNMLYFTDEFVGPTEIYDLAGALVLTSANNSIDISSLPAGVYVVKVGGKAAKVVKQ